MTVNYAHVATGLHANNPGTTAAHIPAGDLKTITGSAISGRDDSANAPVTKPTSLGTTNTPTNMLAKITGDQLTKEEIADSDTATPTWIISRAHGTVRLPVVQGFGCER